MRSQTSWASTGSDPTEKPAEVSVYQGGPEEIGRLSFGSTRA